MKHTTTRIITGLSLSALLIGLVFTPYANAQSNSASGQALEIGPPVINISGDPGQTIKATISIRDIASTNLLVKGTLLQVVKMVRQRSCSMTQKQVRTLSRVGSTPFPNLS
jgi:hypothetical protein